MPIYIGTLPRGPLTHFLRAALAPADGRRDRSVGMSFDAGLWGVPAQVSADRKIAEVVGLARQELKAGRFAAATGIARVLRKHAPEEPEALRILALAPSSLDLGTKVDADHHAAIGDAWRLLGEGEKAEESYRRAFELPSAGLRADIGLALLRLSGERYHWWLQRFYTAPHVRTVMEIGVAAGDSLACVPVGRIAIGVDPKLDLKAQFSAEVHLFPETSDSFFSRGGPDALLAGAPVDVGFIDGLHVFEQALRDFISIERYSGPHSIVLIHDTLPLDEATQRPGRERTFYTGDIWKIVPCLRTLRPDLEVFTIATPFSGLTVVAGLDRQSRRLVDSYEETVSRFAALPYAGLERERESTLAIVPNDWETVANRLKARGIPVSGQPAND